jgi:hypothetical protein
MADMLGDTTLVSDIRGAPHGPRGSAVLEDPTGNRRRRLRIVARLIALAMSIWLVALLLGAVGITPVGKVPFVRVFKPPASPPIIHELPRPRPPSVAELQPALPAVSAPSRTVATRPAAPLVGTAPTKHTRSLRRPAATTPNGTTTPSATTTPSGKTTPANRGKGQGQGRPTTTTTPTTTSTTPGRSGTAPGHTTTPSGKSKQTTGTSTAPTPTG